MNEKELLLKMLKRLLSDLQNIQQKGTGYYTCEPFVSRYNNILKSVFEYFPHHKSILSSFSMLDDTTSVDPLDKMKITQKILVEGDQLEVFLESVLGEKSDGGGMP
jgi:hypothetical protein